MTLMQNNGKFTQNNESGETANCPKMNGITTVQLFPLAWEVNGGI